MFSNLYEEKCHHEIAQYKKKCSTRLLWDPSFGLLPPLYRDYLLRFQQTSLHLACYSVQRVL